MNWASFNFLNFKYLFVLLPNQRSIYLGRFRQKSRPSGKQLNIFIRGDYL